MRKDAEVEQRRQHAERMVHEITSLLPKAEPILARTDAGRDAVVKAKAVMERARIAIAAQDDKAVADTLGALERTLTMFKGVAPRTGVG